MTSYHISIGYNASGADSDEAWETLVSEARAIADNPRAIELEAKVFGAPDTCEDGECELDGYAENYKGAFDSHGHPVSILGDGEDRQVVQWASTGCGMKYHVRRAFVRMLVCAMHRHGIEVNLSVG